jgi:hypothetical protein
MLNVVMLSVVAPLQLKRALKRGQFVRIHRLF